MNEDTLLILENVIKSLKNWQSVCQEWKELPTLNDLNDTNMIMRGNMELLSTIIIVHIERMKSK